MGFSQIGLFSDFSALRLSTTLLYVFNFGLSFYFWYYDTKEPGFKCKYDQHSIVSYGVGFIVLGLLSYMFFLIDYPKHYLLVLATLYFVKGYWHHKCETQITDNIHLNISRAATLSDGLIGSIFGFYAFLAFLAHFYIPLFEECLCFIIVGTILITELHFQAMRRMLEA